jgi:hypothetical protein
MADLAGPQASLDDASTATVGMPVHAPRRSVFREVPWRWTDVLLGFAPFLLLRAATELFGPESWLIDASRPLWIPLTLLTQVWMLVVPLWIFRTRKTHAAGLPRTRAVLVEALFALLALPVVFVAANAASLIVVYLSE